MRLLLDTHVFLWCITGDKRQSAAALAAIADPANEVFLSVASVWEVVVKHGLGRLDLPAPPAEYVPAERRRHRIASLPIDEGSMRHLASLHRLHRDPFDRMLLAQTIQHGLRLVSFDQAIRQYPVALWTPEPPGR